MTAVVADWSAGEELTVETDGADGVGLHGGVIDSDSSNAMRGVLDDDDPDGLHGPWGLFAMIWLL